MAQNCGEPAAGNRYHTNYRTQMSSRHKYEYVLRGRFISSFRYISRLSAFHFAEVARRPPLLVHAVVLLAVQALGHFVFQLFLENVLFT